MWPLLMGGDAAACESAILRITANHPRKEVLADWQAARLLHPVSFANTWRQLLAAAQYRAPLAAPVRTLVLAGVQDQLVNVQCSQALATQWSSTLCLHPTAGHDLTLDDAPWVLKEIRRWHERTRPD
jgi:pimeloyl-ACP methyl ester carboxylesterase